MEEECRIAKCSDLYSQLPTQVSAQVNSCSLSCCKNDVCSGSNSIYGNAEDYVVNVENEITVGGKYA